MEHFLSESIEECLKDIAQRALREQHDVLSPAVRTDHRTSWCSNLREQESQETCPADPQAFAVFDFLGYPGPCPFLYPRHPNGLRHLHPFSLGPACARTLFILPCFVRPEAGFSTHLFLPELDGYSAFRKSEASWIRDGLSQAKKRMNRRKMPSSGYNSLVFPSSTSEWGSLPASVVPNLHGTLLKKASS